MLSSRRQRRNFWVLSIAGCSALFVAALFLVKDWHLVLAEYHSYRLDRAETYEEAKPWLDLLAADAGSPGASDVFLSKLGAAHQHLTCWFFQRVFFEGPSDQEPLLRAFGARLEHDEELLKSWSHYVRWKLGDGLWSALDAMSPSLDVQGSQVFPCGLGLDQPLLKGAVSSSYTIQINPEPQVLVEHLSQLAIGWFLGMSPLPALDDKIRDRVASWLGELRPFQRLLVYDEKLGRCKRRSEEEPLPTLTSFGERGLPVPKVPLPGWKGPVPPLPAIFGEIFLPPLSPNRLKTETLDIDFPQEEK